MAVGFLMVGLKNCVVSEKWCWVGPCSKVVSAVGFGAKPFFLESVCFHLDMFDKTKFRLVLVVCNVHLVIVIKQNIC